MRTEEDKLRNYLRVKGLKLTPQRQLILKEAFSTKRKSARSTSSSPRSTGFKLRATVADVAKVGNNFFTSLLQIRSICI